MAVKPLVAITPEKYNVLIDIIYADARNFTGKPIYKRPGCFLHEQAALCLQKAVILAAEQGFRIKIFDAYRPLEAQQKLWDDNPDPNFISNPKTGAVPHCRGIAIDLTLVKDGKDLDMGTDFDDFTPLSFHGAEGISPEAAHNRYILLGIMMTAGWDLYRNEWWHYQLFNPRSFSALSDKDMGTDMM